MSAALIALLGGCSALPLNGAVLEAAVDRRGEAPTEPVEPVSCQCNVRCGA